MADIDPSLLLAFYCRTELDFKDLLQRSHQVKNRKKHFYCEECAGEYARVYGGRNDAKVR